MSKIVHVHIASLDIEENQLLPLYKILAASEQARAGRFRFRKDSVRFIAARAALRILIAEYIGTSPGAVIFSQNKYGKPELGGACALPLKFNLSHSESLAAFAFSFETEVGVDIELVHPLPGIELLSEQSFSIQEYVAFGQVKSDRKTHEFFRYWTRKEAYLKGLGFGLTIPLKRVDVSGSSCHSIHIQEATDIPSQDGIVNWFVKELMLPSGYVGAIAVQGAPPEVVYVEPRSITSLIRLFEHT